MATAHVICPNLARPEVLFLSIFVEAVLCSVPFCVSIYSCLGWACVVQCTDGRPHFRSAPPPNILVSKVKNESHNF